MKIVFDIDGTLTNFNKYIRENAINYFIKKYNMPVKYPNKLEIQEIFDMDNYFCSKYSCDLQSAKKYTKCALNKYWVSIRFIKFSLFGKFRDGAKIFLKTCKKNGHKIEIHTSRAKSTEHTLIGKLCRLFTYLQFYFNGIPLTYNAFYFYSNDNDKFKGIMKSQPTIVFEDKQSILVKLSKAKIKTICLRGLHNEEIQESNSLIKIADFKDNEINNAFNKLLGKKVYQTLNRITKSDLFFNKLTAVIFFVLFKFKPIVLHRENIIIDDNSAVVIAPNHRRTLDPVIITSIVNKNIHWMALKRFFDKSDSIFNNNKNSILCKITSACFKKLEYFPIERLMDNTNANNLQSLKDVNLFLKNKQYIGIFPEGTTNKSNTDDFGDFDSTFIKIAQKNNAYIQPITIFWSKDNQVIVNIGSLLDVSQITVEEAYDKYITIQKKQLNENKLIIENSSNF